MSLRAKSTFYGSLAVCGLTVLGVHYLQKNERASMHQGVIRDDERTRIKKERQDDFDMQARLQAELLKEQNVRDTSNEA